VVTGFLAGFLGVGGGFIRVPALVYLVGASTHIAVGTDLVEIVFSGGYGALRHSIEGHVDMMAVVFMISGALFGAQLGSIATAYVRGPAIRYVLSYSLILATFGSVMRLLYVLTGQKVEWLSLIAVMLTLGEMIFLCLFILSLLYFARRHKRGAWGEKQRAIQVAHQLDVGLLDPVAGIFPGTRDGHLLCLAERQYLGAVVAKFIQIACNVVLSGFSCGCSPIDLSATTRPMAPSWTSCRTRRCATWRYAGRSAGGRRSRAAW
jgi:uncharacterized membrane protein YfcA